MADTVDTIVQLNGSRQYHVRLVNISDGTGESAVVKVDKSTLVNLLGVEPGRLHVKSIEWTIQGFTSVRLLWDNTTDDEIAVLSGNGYREFKEAGVLTADASATTGDILLTTAGAISGATYDILLVLVKSN